MELNFKDLNWRSIFLKRYKGLGLTESDAMVILMADEVMQMDGEIPVTAPVDDYLATSKNTALTIPLVALTANDSDPDGDQLFVASAVDPSRGSLYFISGNLVFMPEADFVGQASFTYLVSDGQGGTNSAMVYIIVNGSP